MANVKVTINGQVYGIDCGPGQEERVHKLAEYIDGRVQDVKAAGAASTEDQLFVISALILTDELFTAKEAAQSNAQANQNDVVDEVSEAQIQKMISKLGSRITHITKEVEAL